MFTLKQQLEQAQKAEARSHGLWRSINAHIVKVVAHGLKNKRSRKQIAEHLNRAAGPETKGEPISISNIRSAADSILKKEALTLL